VASTPPTTAPSVASKHGGDPAHTDPAPAVVRALAVPGYPDASLAVPGDTEARLPVLVAVHGHRDRADDECRFASRFIGEHAFVLCPSGVPLPLQAGDGDLRRSTFMNVVDLSREVDADLAALARAYPDRIDLEKPVFFGHSTGAYYGEGMVLRAPERWSRAIFAEGGMGGWTTLVAKAFRSRGGQRILFVCGTEACAGPSARAAETLEAAGVPARMGYAAGAGHEVSDAMAEEVARALGWLVEGDPRFSHCCTAL